MVVRFITNRFIGEYDPNLEKIYPFNTIVDNEMVSFEILDAAGQLNENDNLTLEANIRWADAFILMYSVTDKCSFEECNRLKFLINYNKRKRKLGTNSKDSLLETPVILVGNKTDQCGDRMVAIEEGQKRFREISCASFHEISCRESVKQVWEVFRDACRYWRLLSKSPKLKRSTSEVNQSSEYSISPDSLCSFFDINMRSEKRRSFLILGHQWTEDSSQNHIDEERQKSKSPDDTNNMLEMTPFRERASTDGTLFSKPRRWRYPPPGLDQHSNRIERRMSISMRGTNASY